MTATKENKVYTISEAEQKDYVARGFDIYDDDGALVAYGRGKTVPYGDYENLKAEYDALLQELKELQDDIKKDKKSKTKGEEVAKEE